MHIKFAALLAGALLSAAGIAAAKPCAKPADVTAFDVAGLKSKLMVTALTCNQQDRYNDFVQRFRGELVAHERALHAYFARTFGGRAQHEQDDYITSLANTQSEAGICDGSLYCERNAGLMDEVLSLPKDTTLTVYAAGRNLVQPVALLACAMPQRGTEVAQARTGRR